MQNKNIYLALLMFFLFGAGCSINKAFYFPDQKTYESPADYGLSKSDVFFHSFDGTKLHGWFIPSSDGVSLATIVYFHGNAENISTHLPFVSWLADSGFDLFMFDYRGFGRSEGKAERRGLAMDSRSALRTAVSLPGASRNLIVLGQSLGGANAIVAVGSEQLSQVKAVVIEGAFAGYRNLVRQYISISPGMGLLSHPLSWMVSDRYSPVDFVDQITPIPLLLIHGTQDEIIPYEHSGLLFEAAKQPKVLWTVSNGKHLDTFTRHGQWYRPRLVSFLKDVLFESFPNASAPERIGREEQ